MSLTRKAITIMAGLPLLGGMASAEYNRSSPKVNVTVAPIDTSLYDQARNNLTDNGTFQNISINGFIGAIIALYTNIYFVFFWGILWGGLALALYIRQERATVPIVLVLLGGLPIAVWSLPADWQKAVGVFVTFGIAGILYAMRKKRYS
jgi:hypothetical protein